MLPAGVSASDIKSIEATSENIALLTKNGELWIAGYNFELYGDGTNSRDNAWHHVRKANGDILSGIVQIKLAPSNAVAMDASKQLYTWGEGVSLGDGSGAQNIDYPTAMTMPNYQGAHLVQFEITARNRSYLNDGGGNNRQASYFILSSDSKVHVLGANTEMILGINDTNTSYHQATWSYLKDENGSKAIEDVRFIALSHHSAYTLSGALIKADGTLLEWGSNDEEKIGGYGNAFIPKPSLPKGFTRGVDKAAYVAVGGHLTPYYSKDGKYYNVGHNAEGGFGDGTTQSRDAYEGYKLTLVDIVAGVLGVNDFDGDNQPNCRDLDSDNDGIYDIIEAGNKDKDSNGDGMVDEDVGANGFANSLESNDSATATHNYTLPNSDNTAGANYLDIDSDDDGIVDNIEAQSTQSYRTPSGSDNNRNGIDDNYEAPNAWINPIDTDLDGIADYLDFDSDNDNKSDALEGWDSDGDGVANKVASGVDSDKDGLDDGYDNDTSRVNPTNNTTPSSYPDIDNPGNDRDWREAPAKAAISLIKSATLPSSIKVGSIIEYSFFIKNSGNVKVSDIVLIDSKLSGISCQKSSLEPDENITCSANGYRVSQLDIDRGYILNSALVKAKDIYNQEINDTSDSAIDENGTLISNPEGVEGVQDANGSKDGDASNDPTIITIEQHPKILLTKKATLDDGGDGVNVGDIVEYEFTISNRGDVTLYNVEINDSKIGIEHLNIGTLEVNRSKSVTRSYTITAKDIANQKIVNQAVVTAKTLLGEKVSDISDDPLNNENIDSDLDGDFDDKTVTILKKPQIVAKSDTKEARAGEKVTIDIINNDTISKGELDVSSVSLNPQSVGGVGEDRDGDGDIDRVVVLDEGVWEVDNNGIVTFTPNDNFFDDPTPIEYSVKSKNASVSSTATITIHYNSTAFIEGYVWYDKNLDGVMNSELTVVDVEVTLYDANGTLIATTKTDKEGYYKFDSLETNKEYNVAFSLPKGYIVSKKGRDNSVDSNAKASVRATPRGTQVNMGITCSCNASKVDSNYHKNLSAASLNLFFVVGMFMLFIAIGYISSKRYYKW